MFRSLIIYQSAINNSRFTQRFNLIILRRSLCWHLRNNLNLPQLSRLIKSSGEISTYLPPPQRKDNIIRHHQQHKHMPLDAQTVRQHLSGLATGDFKSFGENVDPNVDWIVPPGKGHPLNPLGGHYHTFADFGKATQALSQTIQGGQIKLVVQNVTVDEKEKRAVAELKAEETQKNGKPFVVSRN